MLSVQLFFWFYFCLEVRCDKLIFVHAIWRHGDRTPVHLIPSDTKNNESSWPQGLGELTKEGIIGQYNLGKLLQRRYVNELKLLNLCNASRELHVRSTDYNRTLMSALSLLAGFLNSSCYSINLSSPIEEYRRFVSGWYPFPVHTVPVEEDFVISEPHCQRADWLFHQNVETSQDYLYLLKKSENFLRFLSSVCGAEVVLQNISRINDALKVTRIHADQHEMPKWANRTIVDKVVHLSNETSSFDVRDATVVRLRQGALLGEIVNRLKSKITNLNDTKIRNLKSFFYSAHDSSLMNFLATLGVYKATGIFFVPDYSSCVVLELWKDEEHNFNVKLLYRYNSTDNEFHMMPIGDCPYPCSLSTFIERSVPFVPKNVQQECSLIWFWMSENSLVYLACFLAATIVLFLVGFSVLLVAVVRKLSSRRKYEGYHRVRLDNMSEKFLANSWIEDFNTGEASEDEDEFQQL